MENPFATCAQPIEVDDAAIAAHVGDADLPALLPALAYGTGDLSLLRDELRPNALFMTLGQSPLTEEQSAEIRTLACGALARFRDGGSVPVDPPAGSNLLRILEHTVGESGMDEYLPLLVEELGGIGERDPRAPSWRLRELSPGRTLRAAVIGAGMSGLLAAHRLLQAGIDTIVFEKGAGVGGTWRDNTYPGCRVDNPNHAYSYSFAQRHDWPSHYSTQPTLLGYFEQFADHFGLRPCLRLGHEVVRAEWREEESHWLVTTRSAGGATESSAFEVVVSAVGQLNRPSFPDIEGIEDFAGPSFHSARWEHEVDLEGRTVAVIGTGASALQFIPELADRARRVVVFQRTPPWLAPTPDYHDPVAPGLQWLYRHLPGYGALSRFAMFWRLGDHALETVRVDRSWLEAAGDREPAAVSALNDFARQMMTGYLTEQLDDRPDLLELALPDYPVGAKRVVRDNGIWAATLRREHVELVAEPIERVTASGIVTADGREHRADVLVYGTGFRASEFLAPMEVIGRAGADLHECWGGGARAYLGITVPGFPNFFCLYGPNTNIVINGSIIFFSECGVRYLLGLVRLLADGHRSLEVREEVHDRFNRQVDAQNGAMAWGVSRVNSWYKDRHGRMTQNWPFTLLEYWKATLEPDPAEYILDPPSCGRVGGPELSRSLG